MITTDQKWSEEGQLTTEGNRVMGTQDSLMCVGNECYAISQLARSFSAHAEQWKKVVSSVELHFLLHHVDGWLCVQGLPGQHMDALWEEGKSAEAV